MEDKIKHRITKTGFSKFLKLMVTLVLLAATLVILFVSVMWYTSNPLIIPKETITDDGQRIISNVAWLLALLASFFSIIFGVSLFSRIFKKAFIRANANEIKKEIEI